MSEYAPLGFEPIRFYGSLSQKLNRVLDELEKSVLLRPFFSSGLQFWTMLGCMLVHWKNGRKSWVVGIPALVILAGLWLCTPFFCLYRYAYVVAFIVPFAVCETAVSLQLHCVEKSNDGENG